jgi:hypothetical protein
VIRNDWPQPAVVAEPQICANDSSLAIRYRTSEETIAVIRFSLWNYVIYGAPNDEALGGHPLSKHGLKFYTVHEIEDSSLIQTLERQNSVHPRHDRELYLKDKRHYIFTFQDSTLECVVTQDERRKPAIEVFKNDEQADQAWPHRREV